MEAYITLTTLITIYFNKLYKFQQNIQPDFCYIKVQKVELDNVSFHHVNAHCLQKQLSKQVRWLSFHQL